MKVLLMTWGCDLDDVSEPQVTATWVTQIALRHDVTVFSVSRPDRFGCVREQFPDLDVIEWRDIRVPPALNRFRAIVSPGYLPYFHKARRFLKAHLGATSYDLIHHLSPFAWRYPTPATGFGVPVIRGPVAGGLPTPPGLAHDLHDGRAFMALRRTDGVRRHFDPVLRRSYREVDHVLQAAPYMADVMRGIPLRAASVETEIGLLPDSVPAPRPQRSPGTPLELLYVGRVTATKGLHYAISAIARLEQPDAVVLRVVGDGETLPSCRHLASRLGVADLIDFQGWVAPAAVQPFYAAADLFVFPSVREPSGSVVLEAMANGLPVLTCDYGGPAYVVDAQSGVRVTVASARDLVDGLADAIERFLAEPHDLVGMGSAARARSVDPFGWEKKQERIDALYRQVVAGR